MSYKRIYPTKNTTIFKNLNGFEDGVNGLVNTSKNPILELRDGASKSILLFQFDISSIQDKLNNNTFTSNLCLFDGGLLYEPAILPKYVDIIYFEEEWIEGDGYGFEAGNYKTGISNWNKRTSTDNWGSIFDTEIKTREYHLQNEHEDLTFNIKDFIDLALENEVTQFTIAIRISEEVKAIGSIKFTSGNSGIIDKVKVGDIDLIKGSNIDNSSPDDMASSLITLINNGSSGYTALIDPLDNTKVDITGPTGSGDTLNEIDFTITLSSGSNITYTTTPFADGITGYTADSKVYTKYINGKDTRTVFKPYLELSIVDEIIDKRNILYPDDVINLYFKTNAARALDINLLECKIYASNDTTLLDTLTSVEIQPGLYSAEYTAGAEGVYYEKWFYNDVLINRAILKVNNITDISTSLPYLNNLVFYPTYLSSTVSKGDIMLCYLIAEIRHQMNIAQEGFEFRVIQSNGFEMIPWNSVNVLFGQMYFFIDTEFFFTDIEYIIQTRFVQSDFIRTSDLFQKFKVISNSRNKFDGLNTSPYNSRDYFLRNGAK